MDNSNTFHNALSWKIQEDDVGNIRKKGMEYLKEQKFPTPDYQSFSYENFCSNIDALLETINIDEYIVIFESPNKDLPRFSWNSENDQIDVKELMLLKGDILSGYNVSLRQKIEKIDNSFCGTVIADHKGNVVIETLQGEVNSRFLTSTGVSRAHIEQYEFNEYTFVSEIPPLIARIKRKCEYLTGYYEFAYGKLNGIEKVYYTFYSDNEKYRNIFNGNQYVRR